MDATRHSLHAGAITLDIAAERLLVDGQPVRLGGKAFQLLRLLMEQPETLVTKDAIFAAIWQGLAVSDSVLTTAIKEIRQAIGDNARRPRYIETAHGRGYRFLLPVTAGEAPRAASTGATTGVPSGPHAEPVRVPRLAWVMAAGALLLIVAALLLWRGSIGVPGQPDADQKSLVVLPLDDLTPGGGQAWFAAGLTEEVLNSLAKIPDIRVASRTAGEQIKASGKDIHQAARTLGVAYFMEGSVRRSGDRVRVTAQLIRVADGSHVWSENFDRPATDVIAIQEDIAVAIAEAMKTVLDPERLRAMVTAGTRSVAAYDAFLQGLAFEQRHLVAGDKRWSSMAAEAFERARTIDPGFAEAQWHAARNWYGNDTRVDAGAIGEQLSETERLARYLERVNAAIDSVGDVPERLKYTAARDVVQMRLGPALAAMQAYLKERPRDIAAWDDMVTISAYAGRRDVTAEAAEALQRLSIEAGSPISRAITASVLALRPKEAVERAREQLEIDPGNALTRYQAHRALLWAGRRDEARSHLPALLDSGLPDDSKRLLQVRQACADGRVDEARALVQQFADDSDARLSTHWHALLTLGSRRSAESLLRPLDTPERVTKLMQYLVYPEFNAYAFPELTARMRANGIDPARPVSIPFACR